MSKTTKNRITLVDAVNTLSTIVSAIEKIHEEGTSEDDVDLAISSLMPEITNGTEIFKEKIDARIFVIEHAKMLEEKFKDDAKYLQDKAKILKNMQERVKTHTKYLIENTPGFEWKGTHKEFKIKKNPKGSVNYKFKLDKIENIVDPNDAENIPEEFLEPVKVFTLKKKEFEQAVKDGAIEESVASYKEPGTHLRIV